VPLPRRRTRDSQTVGGRSAHDVLPADRAAAVTHVFNAHYSHLVRMARLLVDDKETAEDVVMDAFMSLHRRWTGIRQPDQAYRYVRSCVLNGARSRLRRRRLSRLHETGLPAEPAPHPDFAVDETERAAVMRLLRALPIRQRQVLVLRYFLDLSEAEIADELGVSPGSVKTHASRGLAALRRALEVCT
jgi:RNA polymerase sigma-70 factor (sigma-E family)